MFFEKKVESDCCACSACYSICPKSAISMKLNSNGFEYPVIDESRCVKCNLCQDVCEFYEKPDYKIKDVSAYGVYSKSIDVRKNSRSGGAFYSLAEYIIEQSGVVWGAAFDKQLNVVHQPVYNKDDLIKLQGSKYVQSCMGNCFSQVNKQLNFNKKVLFSGTACQIAGLLSYIKKTECDISLLYTCDIVCQGVPSQNLYKDYLKYIEKKYNDKVVAFNFRDKTRIGWSGHEESFVLSKRKKKIFSRTYANLYYSYIMRPSCFDCKYTSLNRPADITFADFWGVKEKYPEFADSVGNSLVIINTKKGIKLYKNIKEKCNTIEVDINKCLQPRLKSPSQKPINYDMFLDEYKENGAEYCIEKYGRESLKSKLVYLIKPIVRTVKRLY